MSASIANDALVLKPFPTDDPTRPATGGDSMTEDLNVYYNVRKARHSCARALKWPLEADDVPLHSPATSHG